MEIKIKGMMCAHCSARVEKALKNIGATEVTVQHEKGTANFESISLAQAKKTIEDIGYEVE